MDNRIERIHGNNYYVYEKTKNLKVSDTGEKFSLDYKNEQLQAETEAKEDKEDSVKESAKESGQSALQNGVRLEISNGGRMANAGKNISGTAAKTNNSASLTEQVSSIIESIRTYIATAIAAVKDLFNKIWNEPETENPIQDSTAEAVSSFSDSTVPTESVNTDPNNYERDVVLLDREIRPYLKKGDLDQVINLLTDNGKKTIARNSTLLTYYDKNGRMVEPNASDRERILHGDRNTRKL